MRRYEFSYTSPDVLPASLVGTNIGINLFGSDGLPRVIYDDVTLTATPVPCGDRLLGDVNNDGVFNIGDTPSFANALLDPNSLNLDDRCAADINRDGEIDGRDVQEFLDLLISQ